MNILLGNCTRETFYYISKNSLWFKRLFLDLSHKNSNECLTIDCRGFNKKGPAKFRTKADNLEEEQCYLNITSNNKQYNTYLSKRLLNRESETDKPHFKMEGKRVVSMTMLTLIRLLTG